MIPKHFTFSASYNGSEILENTTLKVDCDGKKIIPRTTYNVYRYMDTILCQVKHHAKIRGNKVGSN